MAHAPMNTYKAQHEKFIKIVAGATPERLIEALSGAENRLPPIDENVVLVPLEANFQLPNVFLNTRRINKVEKLFAEHGHAAPRSRAAERIIGWLDEIQFEYEEEREVNLEEDAQILSAILKHRIGR